MDQVSETTHLDTSANNVNVLMVNSAKRMVNVKLVLNSQSHQMMVEVARDQIVHKL